MHLLLLIFQLVSISVIRVISGAGAGLTMERVERSMSESENGNNQKSLFS